MTVAINPATGEAVRLDESGQWVPTKIAKNPQTGESVVLDGMEWKPVKAAPAPPPPPPLEPAAPKPESWGEYAQGIQEQIGQGIPGMDELRAAARATGAQLKEGLGLHPETETFGESYTRAKGDIDRELEEFQTAHPKASIAANIGGGMLAGPAKAIATPTAALEAARLAPASAGMVADAMNPAARLGLNVAKNAGLGTVGGAVGGFGAGGTPEDPIDLEGRGRAALGGAAFGGVAGAAAPVVGAVAGSAYRGLRNTLGMQGAEKTAERALARTGERAGLTPDQAFAKIEAERAAAPGANVTFADVSPLHQRLGRTVQTKPSAGSRELTDFLDERQAGAGERVMANTRRIVGTDAQNATEKALDAAKQKEASPLFDQAFAVGPIDNDNIAQAVATNSYLREGLQIGYKTALNDATAAAMKERRPLNFNPADYAVVDFDPGGAPIFGPVPNMRMLHAGKMGLDTILEKRYRNEITGRLDLDSEGRSINNVRAALVGEMRRLNPKYDEALNAWAGPSASQDAIVAGRDFMRGDVEEIEGVMAGLGPGDRDYFMIGLSRELRDMINSGRTDMADVTAKVRQPRVQERLRALAGDRIDELNAMFGVEKRMSTTRQVTSGGSITGRIEAEQDDAGGNLGMGLAVDLATGSPGGAVSRFVSGSANRMKGFNEPTSNQLAKMLTYHTPEELDKVRGALNRRYIQDLARQDTRGRMGKGALLGGIAAGTGLMEDRSLER